MEVKRILKFAGGGILGIVILLIYVTIQAFTGIFASSQMSDEIPKQFFQTPEGIKLYDEIYYPVINEYKEKYSIELPLSYLVVPNWSANIKETIEIVKSEAEQAINAQGKPFLLKQIKEYSESLVKLSLYQKLDPIQLSEDIAKYSYIDRGNVNKPNPDGDKDLQKKYIFAYPFAQRYPINAGFGMYAPFGVSTMHYGVDIGTPDGTTVYASHDGIVTYNGYDSISGNMIIIKVDDDLSYLYCHLSSLSPLSVGTNIKKGQAVAHTGHTGNVTGAHCHFEIRLYGKAIDPMRIINLQ